MGYSNHDKTEWVLIFTLEFGRHFGLTLKQAFNYLSRFGGIAFVDEHYAPRSNAPTLHLRILMSHRMAI